LREENLVRITGGNFTADRVSIFDFTGRQFPLKEVSPDFYRIPAWFSGPCFFRLEGENQFQSIFHRNLPLYE
jgi:hypothetical protein